MHAPTATAGAEQVELSGVEHRHHGCHPVVLGEPPLDRQRHRVQVAGQVAAEHALRRGRGARGVEQLQRRAVVDEHLRHGRFAPHRVKPAMLRRAVPEHDHVGDTGGLGQRLRGGREQFGGHDDAPRAGVPEHEGDLAGAPAEVDRYEDHADLRAGVVHDEELRAVPGHDRQSVADRVPVREQPFANRFARRSSSVHVQRRSPSTTASASGYRDAVRVSASPTFTPVIMLRRSSVLMLVPPAPLSDALCSVPATMPSHAVSGRGR